MSKIIGYTTAAALAGIVGLSAGSASALVETCTGNNSTEYELSPASAVVCNPGPGNQANPPFGDGEIDLEFAGMTEMTYTLAYKIDDDGVGSEGDGAITFLDAPTIDDTSGDWKLSGLGEQTVIILKGGNNFAAFLVEGFSGDWEMSRQLSNASIWYKGDITPIPLPASLPLFLGALGGFGFLGWKRRKA